MRQDLILAILQNILLCQKHKAVGDIVNQVFWVLKMKIRSPRDLSPQNIFSGGYFPRSGHLQDTECLLVWANPCLHIACMMVHVDIVAQS